MKYSEMKRTQLFNLETKEKFEKLVQYHTVISKNKTLRSLRIKD